MDGLRRDVRYALRGLARSPGFAVVAVLTLALGIGANTAIFSVVQAVLLRPLPYHEPDRLAMVWGAMTARDVEHFPHSPPDLRDYRERTEAFEEVGAAVTFAQALNTPDGDPEQIMTGGATPNLFRMLGVRPALGRDFTEADGVAPGPDVQPGDPAFPVTAALLSHAFWERRFGGDPEVVGRLVDLGGAPTEIVGVLPRGFRLILPDASNLAPAPEMWTALRLDFDNAPRNNVFLQVVARLAPGVGFDRAGAELSRLAADLRAENEVWRTAGFELSVHPLHDEVVRPVRPVILALTAAVAFVLLIACANVANLLLVRGARREREVAVRVAMGGSRSRIVREVLAESLILAGVGAVLGVVLARVGIRALLALRPPNLPRIDEVGLDPTVLAFTGGAALLAAVFFGVVPALQGSRPDLAASLKDRGRTSDRPGQRFLRNGVVVTEVALSTVLLIGAGLMVRSFQQLRSVDAGFEPSGVLTLAIPLPFAAYPQASDRAAAAAALQQRLGALAGVRSAAAVFPLPLGEQRFNGRWGLEEALTDPSAFRQADYHTVLPGYFETVGARVVEGRTLTAADEADSAAVVVVDRALAERAYPDVSAVDRTIYVRVGGPAPEAMRVVGVVETQRPTSLHEPGRGTIFFPDRYVGSFAGAWVLRTDGDAARLLPAVRAAVAEVDARLPVADVRPMSAYVDDAMASTRFALVLLAAFGVAALVLASVGLYGVLAYVVGQRRAEIGVRMAFGARARGILALVLRQGLGLTAVGLGLGLVAALWLTGFMDALLVGVDATDPGTFAGVALLFAAVATLACVIPAVRASRVDPVVALRDE